MCKLQVIEINKAKLRTIISLSICILHDSLSLLDIDMKSAREDVTIGASEHSLAVLSVVVPASCNKNTQNENRNENN